MDRQAGRQSDVPSDVYEQAVRRVARVTMNARHASKKAVSGQT
jgi:hypothetical protein